MAEIKKFPNQSRYEELAIMEKEEFDKEIEKYEDHPKLKDLIEKYRETSSEGYANLARTSMRGAAESIEEAKQNTTFLKGLALADESGRLQDKISKIISEL